MPIPSFEVATGAVDGVNTDFYTSQAYVVGSLAVFLNGQLKRRDFDDGWEEADPGTGEFRLFVAPLATDVVQASYIDGLPSLPMTEEVIPLFGTLSEVEYLSGRLSSTGELPLFGTLSEVEYLSGRLSSTSEMLGWIPSPTTIYGKLRVLP